MNAAVRATVRMGIACGAKMYLIHEVKKIIFTVTFGLIEVHLVNIFAKSL